MVWLWMWAMAAFAFDLSPHELTASQVEKADLGDVDEREGKADDCVCWKIYYEIDEHGNLYSLPRAEEVPCEAVEAAVRAAGATIEDVAYHEPGRDGSPWGFHPGLDQHGWFYFYCPHLL